MVNVKDYEKGHRRNNINNWLYHNKTERDIFIVGALSIDGELGVYHLVHTGNTCFETYWCNANFSVSVWHNTPQLARRQVTDKEELKYVWERLKVVAYMPDFMPANLILFCKRKDR